MKFSTFRLPNSAFWLFSVLCLLFSNINAQIVFNRAYDYNNTHDAAFSVLQTLDEGYVFIADGTFNTLYIGKTDSIGDTTWTRSYDLSIGGDVGSAIIQLQDSTYVICGTTKEIDSVGGPTAVFLMKLTKDGDSLWFKKYGGTKNDYGDDVKQTSDGGFIIAATSYSFSSDSYSDAYIVKTDSEGNVEWDTAYYPNDNKYEFAEKIVLTSDNNYLIVGYGKDTGNVLLFKINSSGGLLWEKQISFASESGYKGAGAEDISITSDGGFIIPLIFTNTENRNEALLAKTDSVGTLQWHKRYFNKNSFYSFTLSAVTERTDSNYFTVGDAYDSPNPDNLDGCLLAVKSNGDSLWSRFYSHYGAATQEYIYDIQPTKDGGFIMCGNAWGGPNGQDMWLVKTDCMGNTDKWDSVNCPLNVGVKEIEVENFNVEVYPNPFSETATIRITYTEQSKLNYLLEIYDVLGRKVKSFLIQNSTFIISREGLLNGMYFYLLKKGDQWVDAGKLVICE